MLGAITFIMSLFYLVNHSDKDIRRAAYNMIQNTISIFCAVLSYSSITTYFFGHEIFVWEAYLIFLVLFVAIHSLLPQLHSHESLEGASIMGGHLVGFAAADAFGALQRRPPFSTNMLLVLLPVLTTILNMSLLDRAVKKLGKLFRRILRGRQHLTQEEREETHQLIEARENFEDDSLAFCVGYLLCQSAKYWSCGEMEHIHGTPTRKTQGDAWKLIAWSVLLLVVLSVTSVLMKMSRTRGWHMSRRLGALQMMASMAAAWSLLYVGEWQWMILFPDESASRSLMMLALVGTFIAIAAIFVLDFLADYEFAEPRSMRSIITCVSIAVGLSWEKAFHGAQHAVTASIPANRADQANLVISVLMVLAVLPAWRWYILPQAMLVVEETEDAFSREQSEISRAASKESSFGGVPAAQATLPSPDRPR